MLDAFLDLIAHVRKEFPHSLVVFKADSDRKISEQKSYRGEILHIFPAVIDPGKHDVIFIRVYRYSESDNRDEELIPRDLIGAFDRRQLGLEKAEFDNKLSQLIFPALVVEGRMPGPVYYPIPILKILSALLIERCSKRVLSVFEQKIVVIRIRLHACGDFREILHQDL